MVMEDIPHVDESCYVGSDKHPCDPEKELFRMVLNQNSGGLSECGKASHLEGETRPMRDEAGSYGATLGQGRSFGGNDPALWSSEQVVQWLSSLDLGASVRQAFQDQRVTGDVLLALTECDLKHELGLSALGDRRRLALAIKRLQGPSPLRASLPPSSSSSSSRSSPHHCCSPTSSPQSPVTHHHHYHRYCCHASQQHHPAGGETTNGADSGIGGGEGEGSVAGGGWCACHHHKVPSPQVITSTLMRHHRRRSRYFLSDSEDEEDDVSPGGSNGSSGPPSPAETAAASTRRTGPVGVGSVRSCGSGRVSARSLKPEYIKTAISCFYMFLVTWITAIVMVFVHDRVPDRDRHPPLPDIFLDNVPHIPWAFQLCELTIIVLLCTLLCILCLHKHRCIIVRRFAALSGTVFLLRCATMFITSLSVPGNHLQCSPREQRSVWRQVEQAWIIWQGGGLSIKGVRTCGDYMFSGHTTALTMLNFFITEYTPRRLYYIHIASWVLNMFGVFFVLAAHEHYSIDVFIAFYITSRMFLYYHSLANNRALRQKDSFRTKIWFPMFSYFESSIDGIVPNEYSNLFAWENFVWVVEVASTPVFWIISRVKIALIALSGVPGWKDIVRMPTLETSQNEAASSGSTCENMSSSGIGDTQAAQPEFSSGGSNRKGALAKYSSHSGGSQPVYGKYSPDILDRGAPPRDEQKRIKSTSSSPLLQRRQRQAFAKAGAEDPSSSSTRPMKTKVEEIFSKKSKISVASGLKKGPKRKGQ